MAYSSTKGRKPMESASKTNHSLIIRNPVVQDFLAACAIPRPPDSDAVATEAVPVPIPERNPIRVIIAIDGGMTEVPVQVKYPTSSYTFFNFGGLLFQSSDLEALHAKPFIEPEDMAKLRNIQRFQFVLPTVNLVLEGCGSLIDSVRWSIFDFFCRAHDGEKPLINALSWFLFQEYDPTRDGKPWTLASCPSCHEPHIPIPVNTQRQMACPHCAKPIYLTDVFRLHEAVDNEQGAGGVLGYLLSVLEQMLFVHLVKTISELKRSMLSEVLFILDRPLAFFGQTANMHQPMRRMLNHFADDPGLCESGSARGIRMVGVEKSGAFVEHSDAIREHIPAGHALVLGNEYIYRFITPGAGDPHAAFGRTSYYGSKAIFKAPDGNLYVMTLPTQEPLLSPTLDDLANFPVVAHNIALLRCHMYENALVPIALVNQLVSLSDHPSKKILSAFAKGRLAHR